MSLTEKLNCQAPQRSFTAIKHWTRLFYITKMLQWTEDNEIATAMPV